MKKSQWNENEIISLFSQLPSIKDNRDPQIIYGRAIEPKLMKDSSKWLTMTASAAAICLFAFFTLTIFFQEEMKRDSGNNSNNVAMYSDNAEFEEMSLEDNSVEEHKQEVKEDSEKNTNAAAHESNQSNDRSNSSQNSDPLRKQASFSSVSSSALLYKDEVKNMNYMTIGVPSANNSIVPITLMVDKQTTNPVEALKEAKMAINDEILDLQVGVIDWQAANATEEQAVNITFSMNAKEVMDKMVLESLKEGYIYRDVKKLYFYTNEQKGVAFSDTGLVEEAQIDSTPQRAIYLLENNEGTTPLFVPSTSVFSEISEALEVMKSVGKTESMKASIPAAVHFDEIVDKGDHLVVNFSNDTKLEDSEAYVKAIEAILLTAREFGYKTIQFQNSNINTIGSMKLNEIMEVPIAPNVINS
ncbi:GerMN domain-containing protein [Bacillus sp. JJ722]|uniref:GerMN domain-containing protein n=1 Tax=Bacillus sp. JJ722 TaxID=3122973 RepID=UPI002FFDBF72